MPIKRISEQKSKTLEEYYLEMSTGENGTVWADRGNAMLSFIDRLNHLFTNTTIWALTSHDRLVLLTRNSSLSDWNVKIACLDSKEFYFDYLMPTEKRPWELATIKGVANSLDKAIEYLLISMNECGAWDDNEELKALCKDYKIYK